MKLYHDLEQLPARFRSGAVSIGNFDGVHRGHARLIERLLTKARDLDGPAVVFTFEPHPGRILRPDRAPAPLCWLERKAELLGHLGVDAVVAYPTDRAFLQLDARQFFDRIVRRQLDARAMVEGSNFFFGHDRSGDVETLREFCAAAGMEFEVVEPIAVDGEWISSSRIRGLIAAGRIDPVCPMLTHPYRIRGTVVRGAGRGAKLGYPTANLGQPETLLPGEGIYAGRAFTGRDPWPAAISIGPNPTFDEEGRKIEAFLIGFDDSLYGQTIELDFLARLRDIKRFDSVDQLVVQMDRDVAATRQIVEQFESLPT